MQCAAKLSSRLLLDPVCRFRDMENCSTEAPILFSTVVSDCDTCRFLDANTNPEFVDTVVGLFVRRWHNSPETQDLRTKLKAVAQAVQACRDQGCPGHGDEFEGGPEEVHHCDGCPVLLDSTEDDQLADDKEPVDDEELVNACTCYQCTCFEDPGVHKALLELRVAAKAAVKALHGDEAQAMVKVKQVEQAEQTAAQEWIEMSDTVRAFEKKNRAAARTTKLQ
jgi:hypothetical protein